MTIMFCQKCHQVADCRVESPQPTHRSIYYEYPYINAYIRERTCTKCGDTFKTYEIGEATFIALRKVTEMSQLTGDLINKTWAESKTDFFKPFLDESDSGIQEYEEELEKRSSLLPDNVILFPNKNGE
jgi:hypothetical protein